MKNIAIISISVFLSVAFGGVFALAAWEDHVQGQCRTAYASSNRSVVEIQAICGN